MFDTSASLYNRLVMQGNCNERTLGIYNDRLALDDSIVNSHDYHPNAKRNGKTQGMLFTRGGEEHSYNVICRPGDELFAGDLIDAFGQKWIVYEARADATTHKTGVMYECNVHVKFQCFSPEIHETWGWLKVSGYSSSFNSDSQMQTGEEQMALYVPHDENTDKWYIDKRLPSHIAYDPDGNLLLSAYKITGINPTAKSFNDGDHLLFCKVTRDLYRHHTDNIDLMICDYIENESRTDYPTETLSVITGRDSIRVGTKRTWTARFPNHDDLTTDNADAVASWTVECNDAIAYSVDDSDASKLVITVPDDENLIGDVITISLEDSEHIYATTVLEVEVTGFG